MVSLCVLGFRVVLYQEKWKTGKVFLPLAVYGIFSVISTVYSINCRASIAGNFYQFQNIFVLLGFCIISFYAYQVMEREHDYQVIANGMVVTFLCISMTGWLQIFGYDLLNIEWVQQFIMSKEQFVQYGGEIADVFRGNHVFLTLYNPNYAATFLIMFSAVFAVFVFGVHKKDKVWYGLLFFASLVLLWFTYTRAALVALGVGAAVFAFCRKQDVRRAWKCIVLGLLAVSTIWIGLDALNGFKFLSRLADYKEERKLEDIQTTNKGIEISYDGENLLLTMENGKLSVSDETGREMELKADKDGEFLLPFPEPVTAMFLEDADGISCVLNMKECTLQFVKTGEGYFYRNEDGKLDSLVEIPKINMHGWE